MLSASHDLPISIGASSGAARPAPGCFRAFSPPLQIFALGWLVAVVLGIVCRRIAHRAVRAAALARRGYVEFFRNVPLLVWMFFWYFGVPPLLPQAMQDWLFDHGVEFWAGVFALGVYHGARFSEVIRAGIQSIPKTQFEAAAVDRTDRRASLSIDHHTHRVAVDHSAGDQ